MHPSLSSSNRMKPKCVSNMEYRPMKVSYPLVDCAWCLLFWTIYKWSGQIKVLSVFLLWWFSWWLAFCFQTIKQARLESKSGIYTLKGKGHHCIQTCVICIWEFTHWFYAGFTGGRCQHEEAARVRLRPARVKCDARQSGCLSDVACIRGGSKWTQRRFRHTFTGEVSSHL